VEGAARIGREGMEVKERGGGGGGERAYSAIGCFYFIGISGVYPSYTDITNNSWTFFGNSFLNKNVAMSFNAIKLWDALFNLIISIS